MITSEQADRIKRRQVGRQDKELRLTIELVPKRSWGDNLRSLMSKAAWDKVRKQAYARYGYRCGICSTEGRLNCHEIWEYDDKKHIQKLAGFIALCDLCHHVKHFGLANILAGEGKLNLEEVVEHFVKVNKCDRGAFESHVDQAFAKWRERSQYDWKVELGEFKGLVKVDS
jgi:hypothetical protein